MFRHLIAATTALTLTIASISPAHADGWSNEDTGKLIFGLAAIAVIGAALDARDRREDREERATPARQGINTNRSWSDLNDREEAAQDARRALPASCLRWVETRYGHQRLLGQRCLERNYDRVAHLPARCAVRLYSDNGPRNGFDPHCLRDAGFTLDRRR